MVQSNVLVRYLQRASSVLAWGGAGAACYLLLTDDGSNWWDWLMACLLAMLTLYGLRGVLRRDSGELVPSWRAGSIWAAILPFMFPMYLVWWSEDRGSRLAWMGWGLLAAAALVQVSIWRLERSSPEGSELRARVWHL